MKWGEGEEQPTAILRCLHVLQPFDLPGTPTIYVCDTPERIEGLCGADGGVGGDLEENRRLQKLKIQRRHHISAAEALAWGHGSLTRSTGFPILPQATQVPKPTAEKWWYAMPHYLKGSWG